MSRRPRAFIEAHRDRAETVTWPWLCVGNLLHSAHHCDRQHSNERERKRRNIHYVHSLNLWNFLNIKHADNAAATAMATATTTTTTFAHVEWFTRHGNAHAALNPRGISRVLRANRKLRHHCNISQLIYKNMWRRWLGRRRQWQQQPKNFTFLFFHFFFLFRFCFLGSAGALSKRPLALYKALRIEGQGKLQLIALTLHFNARYTVIPIEHMLQHINSYLWCYSFLFIPRIWPQLRSLLDMHINCESLKHFQCKIVMQRWYYIITLF